MPTNGQLALLIAAAALFVAAGVLGLLRGDSEGRPLRLASRCTLHLGIVALAGVLIWHSLYRGDWMPLNDNFDALIWLALLLALFVAYMQRSRPLGALDAFLLPIVVLMLLAAAVIGRREFHPYVEQTWMFVHRAASYGGALGFAVAAAAGAMYVRASYRLRRKELLSPYLASLERLENLSMAGVTVGFALLSIGMITGLVEMIGHGRATSRTKVALCCVAWLIYALVLHAPINPVLRGRRAALLSMIGFVLMIAAVLAAALAPATRQ